MFTEGDYSRIANAFEQSMEDKVWKVTTLMRQQESQQWVNEKNIKWIKWVKVQQMAWEWIGRKNGKRTSVDCSFKVWCRGIKEESQ